MAHTAFRTREELQLWLSERELTLSRPIPEKLGEWAVIAIEKAYTQNLLLCSPEEWNAIEGVVRTGIGLQNGDLVETKFTREPDGTIQEIKLNPNCRWRKTFDRQQCRVCHSSLYN